MDFRIFRYCSVTYQFSSELRENQNEILIARGWVSISLKILSIPFEFQQHFRHSSRRRCVVRSAEIIYFRIIWFLLHFVWFGVNWIARTIVHTTSNSISSTVINNSTTGAQNKKCCGFQIEKLWIKSVFDKVFAASSSFPFLFLFFHCRCVFLHHGWIVQSELLWMLLKLSI